MYLVPFGYMRGPIEFREDLVLRFLRLGKLSAGLIDCPATKARSAKVKKLRIRR